MPLIDLWTFSFSNIRAPAVFQSTSWPLFVLALAGFLIAQWIYTTVILRKKMPPGPLGLPFIGNSYSIPNVKPWRAFTELNAAYGAFSFLPLRQINKLLFVVQDRSYPYGSDALR